MKHSLLTFLFLNLLTLTASAQTEIFNYKQAISGKARTLSVTINSINRTTGEVEFGGVDSRGPTTPSLFFTWIWGDGTSTIGFFPQTKRYTDVTKNYIAKVVSTYSATEKDTVEVLVAFITGKVSPVALDPKLNVYLPSQPVPITSSNNYGVPAALRPLPDAFFTDVSRADFEYLFRIGANIEYDFVNGNLVMPNGKFEQYALRDSTFSGAYALWYARPVVFGIGNGYINGIDTDFSSMYHEMGHNLTLNFPANYPYGGKTDGPANAIFSEAIAQIFQYSTGYEVMNNYQKYGLDDTWLFKLKSNFANGARSLRGTFDEYMSTGMAFRTYNVPSDAQRSREVFRSFLSVPYMFLRYAEQANQGYRQPVKRLMQFLGNFNPEWLKRFDSQNDTPAANAFRATMWVAAMSYAFQRDLRADFRAIGYPISDADWTYLNPALLAVSTNSLSISATVGSTASFSVISSATSWNVSSSQPWLVASSSGTGGNQTVTLTAAANTSISSRTAVVTVSSSGLPDQVIQVVQAGAAPTLDVSALTLDFTSAGGTNSLAVTSNTSWSVISAASWLTVSLLAGTGNQPVSVTAEANTLASPRSATLLVQSNGLSQRVVIVSQAAAPTSLAVSATSFTVNASGGSATVALTSNANWTVTGLPTWLTANPVSGNGNASIALTATDNSSTDSRTASFSITASGTSAQVVTLTQRATPILATEPALPALALQLSPNPTVGQLMIRLALPEPAPAHLSLTDLSGRTVQQWQLPIPQTRHEQNADLRALPPGTYLIVSEADGQRLTGKLILQ
ncbi:BACON domain-containing protein [Fibrella sp. WM1]|uniref:BACON domain-containing protein n=1 Tax=Fibrella musci TaxID=3242485 RepID=UPI003520782C